MATRRRRGGGRDVVYDPTLAEKAFEELARARADLGNEAAPAPRLDRQAVGILAVRLAAELARTDVRPRFESIEAALPREIVERVGTSARALWYAAVQRSTVVATSARGMVPSELVERATLLRTRMLKVVQYHLDEDETAAAEIADIISGTGYADLASDLQRLSQLYRQHKETLAADTIRYRAADAALGASTANEIVQALANGEPEQIKRWTAEVNRSYALLDLAYRRVRLFGLALFDGEGAEDRFPTLFSVRAAPTRGTPEAPAPMSRRPALSRRFHEAF